MGALVEKSMICRGIWGDPNHEATVEKSDGEGAIARDIFHGSNGIPLLEKIEWGIGHELGLGKDRRMVSVYRVGRSKVEIKE